MVSTRPMRLVSDHVHPTPYRDRCRMRLYLPEDEQDAPVVICTELTDNPGMSARAVVRRVPSRLYQRRAWVESVFSA